MCCRDPSDCLSLVHVWFGRIGSSKCFLVRDGRRWLQTQKKKSLVSGQVRAGRVLADTITIDGRKEWTCKFCSGTNVWTQWRCRRCGNNIPKGPRGKHKQAMYAKNKEWYSGSSSSSGREEWRPQGQQEEIRAQVDLHSKQQGAGKSPEEPIEPARSGSDLDEGCRMEVEEEVQSKKKLDEQRRILQNTDARHR